MTQEFRIEENLIFQKEINCEETNKKKKTDALGEDFT
jgi:hypothetical protein